jgi:hypothetical protein
VALPANYIRRGCGRHVSIRFGAETGVFAYVVDERFSYHDREAIIEVNAAAVKDLGIESIDSESTVAVQWQASLSSFLFLCSCFFEQEFCPLSSMNYGQLSITYSHSHKPDAPKLRKPLLFSK